MSTDLEAVVSGNATTGPPIVGAVWSACHAILLSSAGRWLDLLDVANRAANLVDARPSLGDELLHAATAAGLIDTRTHEGRQQVRLTTEKGTE